jgi:putative membrane protein
LGVAAGALFTVSAAAQTGGTPQKQRAETSSSQLETSKTGTDTSRSAMASGKLSASDTSFLKKAAEGGVAEVEFGKLAADKASDPDVKKFGQKMVDDHSKANEDLMKLAKDKGVDVPNGLDAKTQKEKDRLAKLSGAAFDRAYMKMMVSDHKKDVAEFDKMSRQAKDPDVRSFASSKLPTLKEHLELAKTDNSKVASHSTRKAKTSATS